MNKETIMNTYAIEQGYDSWDFLMIDITVQKSSKTLVVLQVEEHCSKVTDLIQEELKKKCAENKHPFTQEILSTEIL